jgi:hypothetical protein
VTEKEPIDPNHPYLIFAYPPDPQFDGEVLRGVVLAAIEDRIRSSREPEMQDGTTEGDLTYGGGRVVRFFRNLFA